MKETTRRGFIKKSALVITTLGIGFTMGSSLAATEPMIQPDLSDAEKDHKSVYTLVTPLEAAPVVVIGMSPTESERFAATELAEHLNKITNREIKVVSENEIPKERKTIAVGKSKLTTDYATSSLGVEQYIVDVKPDGIVIVGGAEPAVTDPDGKVHAKDRGNLYGVYDFLEGLGVRWYRPEPWGWHIPEAKTIELKIGKNVSSPPAFMGRLPIWDYFARWGKTEEEVLANRRFTEVWAARQRANIPKIKPETLDENKYGGRVYAQMGHAHNKIIPPSEYLEPHPEYFALVEGKRGYRPGNYAGGPQLCLGNLALQNLFAEKVIKIAKENPQMYSIAVDPEDGTSLKNRMCHCELCMAMDDPENPTNMSNRVFAFTNIIAKRLNEAVPGAKVGLLAYSAHSEAPTIVDKLEPNIIVGLANINTWSDWTKKILDPTSPQNARFVELVKDWNNVATHELWMREYNSYGWFGPVPMTRLLQDRMQTYRKLGFEGIQYPQQPRRGPQLLHLYFTAQLLWNPDLDVEKELNRFYTNYYGPAASPMKKYHERWIQAFENLEVGEGLNSGISSGARGMHILCTPTLMKELGSYIDEAQNLVKGDALYEHRLKGTWAGYEFSRRVSEILSLKFEYGVEEPNPYVKSKTILVTPKAQEAWENLKQWAEDVNKEDLTFAVTLLDQKILARDWNYMERDILNNGRYPTWNEAELLKVQGFGTPKTD